MFKESRSVINAGITNEVLILGLWSEGLQKEEEIFPNCNVVRFSVFTKNLPKNILFSALKYAEWSLKVVFFLSFNKIDVIHAHSLKSLPVAVIIKTLLKCFLVYDAHELETETYGLKKKFKKVFKFVESICVRFSDEVITVSDSISKYYRKSYEKVFPLVVKNIPTKRTQQYCDANLRARCKISADDILFLHLGGLVLGRGIERLLDAFSTVRDNKHLTFIGSGVLESKITPLTLETKNIHLLESVPSWQVTSFAKEADLGLCLTEDTCLNNRLSLPNKLFEYLMAGLPTVVNDLPEQRKFVEKYKCGWIISHSYDLSDFLRKLSLKDILEKKRGAEKVCTELSWEKEVEPYLRIFKRNILSYNNS